MGNQTYIGHINRLQLWAAAMLACLPTLAAPAQPSSNYTISPNDLVQVKVFQELDLTTETRVANDGTITVPLIGAVRIGGKSIEEAANVIRVRLMKGFLVDPQVNVSVAEFAKRRFTVIGQVQKGGTFDFPDQGGLDLLQAIGLGGGYSRIADPSKVTVRRSSGAREEVFRLNAKTMAAGGKAFEILPGDTITVGESVF